MNKIAIISDIHGNLEALTSVLDDIKKRGINEIYCLGDIIAKGQFQKECLKLVKENCKVIVQGNCDFEYAASYTDEEIINAPDEEIKRYKWCNNLIDEEDKKYILNLPYSYEFFMSGRLIRIFHAHPENIDRGVGNIDTLDNYYSLFLPSGKTVSKSIADVVIYGHIHIQYVQKIYNRTIINAGSVGNSLDIIRNEQKDGNLLNTTVANYVVLTGNLDSKDMNDSFSYELVSIPYDIDKELSNNIDNPEFITYQKELKEGKYRDINKLYKILNKCNIDTNTI